MTIDIEKLKFLFEKTTGRKNKETKLKWKLDLCLVGEECWCRCIDLLDKPAEDDDYVAPSGSLHKDDAEFMVELYNAFPEILKILEKENDNA